MKDRILRASFFDDEEIAALPPLARLLFQGLWAISDRDGNFKWLPRTIQKKVLGFDDCDIDNLLTHLIDGGFILRYEVEGRLYGQVVNFTKHQKIHYNERPSDIPRPCTPISSMGSSCVHNVPIIASSSAHNKTIIHPPCKEEVTVKVKEEVTVKVKEAAKFPTEPADFEFADTLIRSLSDLFGCDSGTAVKSKKARPKWAEDFAWMRLSAGRSPDMIRHILRASAEEPRSTKFTWRKNIRGPLKIHERWDDLLLYYGFSESQNGNNQKPHNKYAGRAIVSRDRSGSLLSDGAILPKG